MWGPQLLPLSSKSILPFRVRVVSKEIVVEKEENVEEVCGILKKVRKSKKGAIGACKDETGVYQGNK